MMFHPIAGYQSGKSLVLIHILYTILLHSHLVYLVSATFIPTGLYILTILLSDDYVAAWWAHKTILWGLCN